MIRFSKACVTGNEIKYIQESIETFSISGDNLFTKKMPKMV